MLNNISELSKVLSSSNYKVYRDYAESDIKLPYIIYQHVNEEVKYASNTLISDMGRYQLSLITKGTEKELQPLIKILKTNGVLHSGFTSGPFQENDNVITQYNCFVRFRKDVK